MMPSPSPDYLAQAVCSEAKSREQIEALLLTLDEPDIFDEVVADLGWCP